MYFNPYGGLAAEMAAALVNLGPDASPDDLYELLVTHDYLPRQRPTPQQTGRLLDWAARLRPMFDETDLDRQVDRVNELLAESAARPYVSQHHGRTPHLHFADEQRPLEERLRAYTAAGLATAICQDATRLGSCARDGCEVVYVDSSRNGRRRFCSTRCANRVYVADHRRRHAAEGRDGGTRHEGRTTEQVT
ncbi:MULTISPECIES: CGNR zinc finger domain-containing protein [Actinoalloteichus]|uniref:DUF1470 family protein/CGNR zinc finger n=1 Tax=Actinoalloteichus fjordicus TaxID=1612552 RepID=A0AAC9PS58_9PSEU|nr:MULTISPECIES: CGNR zinc finger domain-containing protein [Actinoalloteichus]APU14798.1 putative DUF1470 family protein/CGNR zinc finger [Actinoalloteichus fjordicus]APU20769.1 putative DUF1470 family protein/CGNR zinc finger [Actinoalloteichus sp. GBA129-24]